MRRQKLTITHLFAIGCAAFLAGCDESEFPGATLKGMVTIDGNPVESGSLEFIPEQGGAGPAAGANIVEGFYTAQQVPLGKVRVFVRATRKTGRMVTDYSEAYEEEVSIVPPRYLSGEVIDVAGDGSRDFALTSH